MTNLINTIKAFFVCTLTSGIYILYISTSSFQEQLAREGQEVGKIEALMHYSTIVDVWSRMISGWLQLLAICFVSCLILLLWLKKSGARKNSSLIDP